MACSEAKKGPTNTCPTHTEGSTAWHRHLQSWIAAANAMRKEEVFTDVVLVCGKKEFPAHRLMLSGTSPYFRAMLHSPMTESNTGRIVLDHLDPDAVEVLLDFIYTGTVKDIENDTELMKAVLEASHMLLMDTLFEYVIRTMAKQLSSDCFLELWNTAELYNHEEILEDIKEKIGCKEFEAASTSKDFAQLTITQLRDILTCVNPSFVNTIVKAILEWTRADSTQRIGELHSLLKGLKLNKLSEKYLKYLLSSEPIISQNQEVFQLLVTVSLESFQWTKARKGSQLLCFAKESISPRLSKMYILEKNSWSKSVILSFRLTRHMTALGYDGYVYFMGCKNINSDDTDEVWVFCPKTHACHTILKLKHPVSAAVPIDLLGSIYVVGGFAPYTHTSVPTPVKTVQRFNPVTKFYSEIAPMFEAHWFPVVGQLHGCLYVTSSCKKVERYDPNANQWTTMNPTPFPMFGACGSFGEGKLFIMANKKNPCDLQVFDPNSNVWDPKILQDSAPVQISGRWTLRTHESDKSIMMVHDKSDDTIHYYNPGSESWKTLTPKLLKRFELVDFCVVTTQEEEDEVPFWDT